GGSSDAYFSRLEVAAAPPPLVPLPDDAGALIETPAEADGGDPAADADSETDVRYFDGAPVLTEPDLESDFGTPWELTRTWVGGAGPGGHGLNGNGWADKEAPYLLASNGTHTLTLVTGGSARYFDLVGSSYVERLFLQDQLAYDSANGEYVLT